MESISLIKEIQISKSGKQVGTIKLVEKDLESESNFVKTLQKLAENLNNGGYSVTHKNSLFARFDIKNKQVKLHKWSENTGVIMPCWNYFKE